MADGIKQKHTQKKPQGLGIPNENQVFIIKTR
jgi:hypothetical protein